MSIIKHQLAESSDKYWQMRKMYSSLVRAIQDGDTATMFRMANDWDRIREAEEQDRKNFINSLKKS